MPDVTSDDRRQADEESRRPRERPGLGPDRRQPDRDGALHEAQILHQEKRQADRRDQARLRASAS